MGLAYTIDTPVKVARFGISSVVSIIQDVLVEQMRQFHSQQEGEEYIPIAAGEPDHRARRIRSYLQRIVQRQTEKLRREEFKAGSDIVKYFELLPDDAPLKQLYLEMKALEPGEARSFIEKLLRENIVPGDIDVNIMTKLDNLNYSPSGDLLPVEYADAMSALRGFALSGLSSSVIFSAGLNPRLYSYCGSFSDFFPDADGRLKKKIILKVSDYRSALIQGRFLAKKGLWISEFRIESGLNCGGHAFPTEGILLGPILEEFRGKRDELKEELLRSCNEALKQQGKELFKSEPEMRISVQGGIGTRSEHDFLLQYYKMDAAGWGSPFLLVPEATNVDDKTLVELSAAKKEDYFISMASPLGIPFNNFRKSSSEYQRLERIKKGRPGSPCYKKYLAFNTEFTPGTICVSSRQYQDLKLKALRQEIKDEKQLENETAEVLSKDCLCEGLAASALLKNGIPADHGLAAVAICPGPNLAYFSGIFTLEEMVSHIYGRKNLLNALKRSNMFINEIVLYVEYLQTEIRKNLKAVSAKKNRYFSLFRTNLLEGIDYYKKLGSLMKAGGESWLSDFRNELSSLESRIMNIALPEAAALT
jgi:hypothetical protein